MQHFTAPAQRLHSPTGHDLTTVHYKGQPCWIAQEIGAALGYSEGGSRLSKKITQDWAEEVWEGEDYFKIEGEELAELRAMLMDDPPESGGSNFAGTESVPANPIDSKTRNLLLLTEQGVWLACIKSNKPAGILLRRWLASEVLPSLRRRGRYTMPSSSAREAADAFEASTLQERRLNTTEAAELRHQATQLRAAKAISHAAYLELLRRGAKILAPDLADLIEADDEPTPASPKSNPGAALVAAFLEARCELAPLHFTPAGDLYATFCLWCQEEGYPLGLVAKAFGKQLAQLPGLTSAQGVGGVRGWRGVRLLSRAELGLAPELTGPGDRRMEPAEAAAWEHLVQVWWERWGKSAIGAGDLLEQLPELLPLEPGSRSSQLARLGWTLQALSRQSVAGFRLQRCLHRNMNRYALQPIDAPQAVPMT